MRRRNASIIFLLFCLLSACAAPSPTWRAKASLLVNQLSVQEASRLFPQEYLNLMETFEYGETALNVKADDETADTYYLFVIQKGGLLLSELQNRKLQMAEDERRRVAEQASRAEEERISREAAEDVQRLIEQESQKTAEAAKSAKPEKILVRHVKTTSHCRSSILFIAAKPFPRLPLAPRFTTMLLFGP